MIWVAKGQKVQQIPLHHSDIIAVLLSLHHRSIFIGSVYIICSTGTSKDEPRLVYLLDLIYEVYLKMKESTPELELISSTSHVMQ